MSLSFPPSVSHTEVSFRHFCEHLWSAVIPLGGEHKALHYTAALWFRLPPLLIYIQILIQIFGALKQRPVTDVHRVIPVQNSTNGQAKQPIKR